MTEVNILRPNVRMYLNGKNILQKQTFPNKDYFHWEEKRAKILDRIRNAKKLLLKNRL